MSPRSHELHLDSWASKTKDSMCVSVLSAHRAELFSVSLTTHANAYVCKHFPLFARVFTVFKSQSKIIGTLRSFLQPRSVMLLCMLKSAILMLWSLNYVKLFL